MTMTDQNTSKIVQSFQDLKVWQLGMELSKEIYLLTTDFPNHEQYGITSQLRRAATSVPANIADGHGRDSSKEFLRHLSIAQGSIAECITFLHLTVELEYTSSVRSKRLFEMFDEEGKMIRGLQKSLKNKISNP